jgi:hypothetical protein
MPVLPAARADVYHSLRAQAFKTTRSQLGPITNSDPNAPWGVIMDWIVPDASVTVVALADGTASVYLSNGGGFIGGQGLMPIRTAAQVAVLVAAKVQEAFKPTAEYPLPSRGTVAFYLLGDAGVTSAAVTEAELGAGHPLARLGNAMQAIITGYRSQNERARRSEQQ